MSQKAGAASDLIAVPKGGGAQKGLGEKFSADLHTGAGNFSVPIAVPAGRNGLQPQLTLSYSTGAGNGPFGLGWSLGVPGVTRLTSKGIPRYRDGSGEPDTFVLSGAEDLVEMEVTDADRKAGIQTYRPRTEGLFAVIQRHAQGTDHWEVRTKDGLTSVYGTPGIVPATSDADLRAVVADPQDRHHVFSWRLSQTSDPFGNRIVYDHRRDNPSGHGRDGEQLYLKRIRYVDHGANADDFLVSVEFLYDDEADAPLVVPEVARRPRPDPFSEHRAGFEVRTRRRCKWVVVRTHPSAGQELLVRAYELIYLDEQTSDPEQLPLNGATLLSRINVIGYTDGPTVQGVRELPPLDFDYSRFTPAARRFTALEGKGLPTTSLADPDLELVDLFGRGLPDIVELGGAVRYWRNLGGGRFDMPRPFAEVPSTWKLSDVGVQLLDANGDGRADLVVTAGGASGHYPLDFRARFSRSSYQPHREAPSFSFDDPEVRLIDLTGDGVTDALRSGSSFECFFNHATEGWSSKRTARIPRERLDAFPDVSFTDPRVKFADLSGDGLQDIAVVHQGRIDHWPHRGHGRWGHRITTEIPAGLPQDFDPQRVLLGDVDGDGVADLLYVSDRKLTLWINRSGNGWSEPITLHGTPAVNSMVAVRLTDLLGTGVPGLLWTRDAGSTGRPEHFFLDLTGGQKPYLLNRMDNHLGAVTEVTHVPSTRSFLRDQAVPATRWRGTLPFPVQVVERVTVTDELSGGRLTTEYRYHHGHWDGVEREFRGFGMVEQLDTEVFDGHAGRGLTGDESLLSQLLAQTSHSPPLLSFTWFHQGPVEPAGGGPWQEFDGSPEQWPGDPNLLGHCAGIDQFLATLGDDAPRARRDAMRALRGSVLRTELYALDASPLQARPYTVTEQAYGLREERAAADAFRVFFPFAVASRTTQWERGDDPLTQLSFTADRDEVGQAQRQLSVACPRGWRGWADRMPAPFLATLSQTMFARPQVDGTYIRDRVARVRVHELTQTAGQSIGTLVGVKEGDAHPKRVIAETLRYFDGPAYFGLAFGIVGGYGVPVREESLVLTQDIVARAYLAQAPAYLDPGQPFPGGSGYPQDFANQLPRLAGYTFCDGAADSPQSRGWFVQGMRASFDFQQVVPPGKVRGLLLAQRDALGYELRIDRYVHELLPAQTTGPTGLVAQAEYNLRVMQPTRVTDPNGNLTEVEFSASGLVTRTFLRGKPGAAPGDRRNAGDIVLPSIEMHYELRAFHDSRMADPRHPVPAFVRALRRIDHDSDPLASADTIEAREYSDGFGRLLQTRTQGEALRFGDADFGGGDAVLPADQDMPSSGAVTGHENTDPLAPNVIVSGWQRYDNKGRVVEKFEPFFDAGWAHRPDTQAQRGRSVKMVHDARGRVVCTINPDRSEQRVIQGIPLDLADPPRSPLDAAKYKPTPWEAYTYDPNDNAGRTHAGEAPHTSYPLHHDTPSSVEVDALGRTVKATVRHRDPPTRGPVPAGVIEEHITRSTFDIQGNVTGIHDTLGRLAFGYVHDLVQRPLRTESIDAGHALTVLDAAGNPVESRSSKGAWVLHAFDALHRPTHLWARDAESESVGLRERLFYDDDPLGPGPAADRNLLGKLVRHQDEAGVLAVTEYDFKGQVLRSSRQVLSDEFMLAPFKAQVEGAAWDLQAPRVDWSNPPPGLLDPRVYETLTTFDAVGRVRWTEYPECANGERYRLRPGYNRAGALERVGLEGPLAADGTGPLEPYVKRVAYNAKGQRLFIVYGNGLMTRHAYDPATSRLTRLRTDRLAVDPGPLSHQPQGSPLQDIAYVYDLVGNILSMQDRTPGSGVANNAESLFERGCVRSLLSSGDALLRRFEYDPLYRLTSATGREGIGLTGQPRPWSDVPREGYNSGKHGTPDQDNAPQLTGLYREQYAYDAAGNMLSLRHSQSVVQGGAAYWSVAWTRRFGVGGVGPSPNNRLTHVQDASTGQPAPQAVPQSHFHDDNGNLTRERNDRRFEWDHANRLKSFRNQLGTSRPTVYALYLYDAGGLRVKKLVVTGAGYRTTNYLGTAFEQHATFETIQGLGRLENCSLHVMDDVRRIAILRAGLAFDGDVLFKTPSRYFHSDHLQSGVLIVSGSGDWINKEEHFPFGETSFGSFKQKSYRYTGRERDEESGLAYHLHRYFSPWIARWISSDPMGAIDGTNICAYAGNNPISQVDLTGTECDPQTHCCEMARPSHAPAAIGKDPAEGTLKSDKSTLQERSAGEAAFRESVEFHDFLKRQYGSSGELAKMAYEWERSPSPAEPATKVQQEVETRFFISNLNEGGSPPAFRVGEIKPLNERGIRAAFEQFDARVARDSRLKSENLALVLYEVRGNGQFDVYAQIFGPVQGAAGRRIIYEARIGLIFDSMPNDLTPVQLGNALEVPIRSIVQARFPVVLAPKSSPSANGPDLRAVRPGAPKMNLISPLRPASRPPVRINLMPRPVVD